MSSPTFIRLSSWALILGAVPMLLPGLNLLVGPGVQLTCLALFGAPALLRKVLPHWNVLPLLAGAGYSLVSLLTRAVPPNPGEPPRELISIGQLITMFSSIALILLGYVLQGDAVREWPDPSGANSSGS